jgi:cytochrome c
MRQSLIRLATMAGALTVFMAAGAHAQAGNAAQGKTLFTQQCMLCHSPVAGQEGQAPSLFGVVGRKAASDPGFTSYTAALKTSGLTWTPANLNKFLGGPAQMVPGTAMPITLASPADRANVIAYLATLKKGR